MAHPFLEVKNISVTIDGNPAVNNVSFSQQEGSNIAIAGETGSGKTSLLKMIAGLIQPASGSIFFQEKRVLGPDEKLIAGHKNIGYISQYFELRNNYRVEEELSYNNQLTEEEANHIFEICQVNHLTKRWTDELSGGEKQRIVTARVLIAKPTLLLLDEPFSNLDPAHKETMKKVLEDIAMKLGISCLLTSHDPADSLSWADEIIVMQHGSIIQQGTPENIYREPLNEYVAGLFGKYSIFQNNIVRPENFIIQTASTAQSVPGIVKDIFYYGAYFEMKIVIDNGEILVRTDKRNYKEGDHVFIELASAIS